MAQEIPVADLTGDGVVWNHDTESVVRIPPTLAPSDPPHPSSLTHGGDNMRLPHDHPDHQVMSPSLGLEGVRMEATTSGIFGVQPLIRAFNSGFPFRMSREATPSPRQGGTQQQQPQQLNMSSPLSPRQERTTLEREYEHSFVNPPVQLTPQSLHLPSETQMQGLVTENQIKQQLIDYLQEQNANMKNEFDQLMATMHEMRLREQHQMSQQMFVAWPEVQVAEAGTYVPAPPGYGPGQGATMQGYVSGKDQEQDKGSATSLSTPETKKGPLRNLLNLFAGTQQQAQQPCQQASAAPEQAYAGSTTNPTLAELTGYGTPASTMTFGHTSASTLGSQAASTYAAAQTAQAFEASGVSMGELRKIKTILPKLNFVGSTAFQQLKCWREWTINVQLEVSLWHETASSFWLNIVEEATAKYASWCALSVQEKSRLTAESFLLQDLSVVPPASPLEAVFRNALRDALPQHAKFTSKGIYKSTEMLLEIMKLHLPSESFIQLGVVDTVECHIPVVKNLSEATAKLRDYLRDLRLALHILSRARNPATLNPLKIYSVIRTFVQHMATLDNVLSTRVIMKGYPAEGTSISEMHLYAQEILGMTVERVREDKVFKANTRSTNQPNVPMAAAISTVPVKGKGQGKAQGNPHPPPPRPTHPRPDQGKGVPNTKKGVSGKVEECKYFNKDDGCQKGANCLFLHRRVEKNEGKCFNCGSKSHSYKDCDRPKPDKKSSTEGKGHKGASVANPKPKAKPAVGSKSKGKGKDKAMAKNIETIPEKSPLPGPCGTAASGSESGQSLRLKGKMRCLIDQFCFIEDSFPAAGTAAAVASEPDSTYALLDSGATHVILNLSALSEEGQREGRTIGLKLAAGRQCGKIYRGEIFLKGVKRSLCPLGKVLHRLQLRLDWAQGDAKILARSETQPDVWLPVLQPTARNDLLYIKQEEFEVVRDFMRQMREKVLLHAYYPQWQSRLSELLPEERALEEFHIVDVDGHVLPALVPAPELVEGGLHAEGEAEPPEPFEYGAEEGIARPAEAEDDEDPREAEYGSDPEGFMEDETDVDVDDLLEVDDWDWEGEDTGEPVVDGPAEPIPHEADIIRRMEGDLDDPDAIIPWQALDPIPNDDPVALDDEHVHVSEEELMKLEEHIAAGHVPKLSSCPVCQLADGPVRVHKTNELEHRATGVLTLDIAGPLPESVNDKYRYILVGAYRGTSADGGGPTKLLPLAIPLVHKNAESTLKAVKRMVAFVESLNTVIFAAGRRVLRIHSDRGGEFENEMLKGYCDAALITQTFSSGHSPQSAGAAEVNVRILKQILRRLLIHAHLKPSWWSYALQYALGVLQSKMLGRKWDAPAFGETVAVKRLVEKNQIPALAPRGEIGRMLTYNVLTDRACKVLVGTKIVTGTAPKPVMDKLSELMTQGERDESIRMITDQLSSEDKQIWEPVLSPGGKLLWVNKLQKYAQYRTPQFVQVAGKEPIPEQDAMAFSAFMTSEEVGMGKWFREDFGCKRFLTTLKSGPLWSVVKRRDTFDLDTHQLVCSEHVVDMTDKELHRALPQGVKNTRTVLYYDVGPMHLNANVSIARLPKSGRRALKQVERATQELKFPTNASREALQTEEGFPKSLSMGLSVRGGYSIAYQTMANERTLQQVHRLAKTRPKKDATAYSAVQICRLDNTEFLKVHRDVKNSPQIPNWTICTGTFEGGRVWYQCENGSHPPPRECQRTPEDGNLRGVFVDTHHQWLCFPAKDVLHCVEPVKSGTRYSITLYSPNCLKELSSELIDQLEGLNFPLDLKEKPQGQARCVRVQTREDTQPCAMAVQEIGHIPENVDTAWSEIAKAHPISLNAVRKTTGAEREKWKASMKKEIQGLLDRETYTEVKESSVNSERIQQAPARMVYVIKPSVDDKGVRTLKRKSRLVICGNFLMPYGETSTANLDVAVFRSAVAVGLTKDWKFASTDIPQAFLNASIDPDREVYLRPPKICIDMGLVPEGVVWKLNKALYGLRESPKLWEERRDKDLEEMKIPHGKEVLRFLQSSVHSSLWHVVTQKVWDKVAKERATKVKPSAFATDLSDRELEAAMLEFPESLGLLCVYVDDFFMTAPESILLAMEAEIDKKWKTGEFQVLGRQGTDEIVYLGIQLEYEPAQPGKKDSKKAILLHQDRYTQELLEKFPELCQKPRAVPSTPESFKDLSEAVGAPLPKEATQKKLSVEDQKLVKQLQRMGGSLLWLVIRTRPDLAWAYSRVASLITRAPKAAYDRMKQLFRYVAYTGTMALKYVGVEHSLLNPLTLQVFSDISFAPNGEKSHEGILVLWGSNVLSWKSGRQSLIATSTAEAELIGASNAAEAVKAGHLIVHSMLGSSDQTRDLKAQVWCDNQSSIAQIMKDASSNIRTRHISIRAHRLGHDIREGLIDLGYVSTENQRADSLTKGYSKPLMCRQYEHLSLHPLFEE